MKNLKPLLSFIFIGFLTLLSYQNCSDMISIGDNVDSHQNQQQEDKTPTKSLESNNFVSFMPKAIQASDHKDIPRLHIKAPPFLGYSREPLTGAKVWRLGGTEQEMTSALPMPSDSLWTETHGQHYYSRNPVTNKYDTYALGSAGRNTNYAPLWRMKDKKLVAWVPTASKQNHWSQRLSIWDKNRNTVYWYAESNKLIRAEIDFNTYDVTLQTWDTFNDFEFISLGRGEAEMSDDGDKIVIFGHNGEALTLLSYVISQKQIVSSLRKDDADWASVDPSGKFVAYARMSSDSQAMESVLFDDLSSKPVHLFKKSKHCTFFLDNSGRSWLSWGDWRGVFIVHLESGKTKKIWPNYVDNPGELNPPHQMATGHISRVANLPSVLLVSRITNGDIFFINADKPGYSVLVGNAHYGKLPPKEFDTVQNAKPYGINASGEVTNYYREARASASRSGRYVFFTSDYRVWGQDYGDYNPEPPLRAFLNVIEIETGKR